jgi:type IV pilus assembly protein PilV
MKIQRSSAGHAPRRRAGNHSHLHAGKHSRGQNGSYLLEALIAILIFSFGILGLIGLLGSSIRITNDARYRTEASNLASAMIADMWVLTSAQLDAQFGSGGSKLTNWETKVAELLPQATGANKPTVDLTPPGLSQQSRTAIVTVYWQLPGETTRHQHVMTAQIGRN